MVVQINKNCGFGMKLCLYLKFDSLRQSNNYSAEKFSLFILFKGRVLVVISIKGFIPQTLKICIMKTMHIA